VTSRGSFSAAPSIKVEVEVEVEVEVAVELEGPRAQASLPRQPSLEAKAATTGLDPRAEVVVGSRFACGGGRGELWRR
jgi:hypothetical protein